MTLARFLKISMWVLALCSAAMLAVNYVRAHLRQMNACAASAARCEDALSHWRVLIASFAGDHDGRLPRASERHLLAGADRLYTDPQSLRCNTGLPYHWNENVRQVDGTGAVPLMWCGRTHGYTYHWRNVLYSDLTLRKVPEPEFAGVLRAAGVREAGRG
jgi:hypothetical protein